MTGVSNVNGFALLAERQKMLKSLEAQKSQVLAHLDKANQDVSDQQKMSDDNKNKLADYVVALSNLKEPDKVDEPGKEPLKEDYKKNTYNPASDELKKSVVYNKDSEYDMDKFNTEHKEWEKKDADYKQYQKDLEDYNNQKEALEEKINEYKGIEKENANFLKNLTDIAKQAEQDVIKNGEAIDVNTGDIEKINAQLADAKFEVKAGDGGDKGMVAATFNDLQKAGLISQDAKPGDFTQEQLQKMCKELVTAENENNGTNYNVNGMDKHHKTMSADDSSSFSYAQMDKMAEALGLGDSKGLDLNSYGLSMEDLDNMGNEYAANKTYGGQELEEVTVVAHSSVKTPRGIHFQDLNPDGTEKPENERRDFNRLSTHGLTAKTTTDAEGNETIVKDDKGRTIYVRIGSDGKPLANSREFNSDEVNEYFREIENSVASGYSRVLDKAEKYGVDIEATTEGITNGKEAKKALNEAIDVKKAEQKYKDEIEQYGINTEGMSAKDIKNAVKQAKKGNYGTSAQHTTATPATDKPPVYTDGGSETVMKAEPAVTAPVTDHPPVNYSPDGADRNDAIKDGTVATTPTVVVKGSEGAVVKQTPSAVDSHHQDKGMSEEDIQRFSQADPRVAHARQQLPILKKTYEDLQRQYDGIQVDVSFEKMFNGPSLIDVKDALSAYQNTQNAIKQYENILSTWKDGQKSTLTTGRLAGEIETVTLDNGAKGYKAERYENGKKVTYYLNMDFDTEFGSASSIPSSVYKKVIER